MNKLHVVGLTAYKRIGNQVVSMYVTERFSKMLTLIDLESDTVTGIRPFVEKSKQPFAIAIGDNDTLWVSSVYGLYLTNQQGITVEWIIQNHVPHKPLRSPDGEFGEALGHETRQLIRIPNSPIYIFTDSIWGSVRAIDTDTRKVYTLCFPGGRNVFKMPGNGSIPSCKLDRATSVMVNADVTELLVGYSNAAMRFKLGM